MEIKHINTNDMVRPRGYSHAVYVSGNRQTIYIGGQNAVDENGNIVGKGDLKKQVEQILSNIEKISKNAGAELESIVKFNIYILFCPRSSIG